MIAMAYSLVAYALFFLSFLYTVGFVEGIYVSRTLDGGTLSSLPLALAVDIGWFILFAVQHSGMARASFKQRWTRLVPPHAERSTYVLASALMVILLLVCWQPIPIVIWRSDGILRQALYGLSFAGWGILLLSSYLIDHFELFGLRQPWDHLRKSSPEPRPFATPLLYRYVRHPLYLGFLIAFWAAPTMSVSHFIFALGMTAYALIGVRFEERDLVRHFGDEYRQYQARVGMLLPRLF
jgi:protein-S-isoprenylcysteine O-methyltransferase Ste14